MATNKKTKRKSVVVEADSTYFLKLVMYLIVSSLWIRVQQSGGGEIPIPAGAIIALIFATHDHFQIDRKIEFALILVSMFIAFWLPIGLYISL
jgi:hypothetical protein